MSTGVFEIDFPENVVEYELCFYNLQGQKIELNSYFCLNQLFIEDQNLKSGTYFLHCKDKIGNVEIKKIVVI